MKPSRILSRFSLLVVGISTVLVTQAPRLAVWLANVGDTLSAISLKLGCYGR
jgi:hypothetical protein